MREDYIYGVARVRARETVLLTKADFERLMACPTQEDCLRLLRERGWGRGEGAESPEGMLAAEEEKTWSFLHELCQDETPFLPLLAPIDGNNLKAAIKCAAAGIHPGRVFLPGGRWAPEALLQWAQEGDFSSLPPPYCQAAKAAQQALLQTGDGQLCDVRIDRACLEEILQVGQGSGLPALERYCQWTVATADLQTAARACAAGKNLEFLRLALAPCQGLDVEQLAQAAVRGRQALEEYAASTPFGEGMRLFWQAPSAFEKWRDDAAMELLQAEKSVYESAGPLFAYAVARRREIDTVRILLSGKRNGLQEEKIRERLRETYV